VRPWGPLMLALAGCAAQTESAGPDRSALVAACAAAVAEHVGKGTEQVEAAWAGTSPAGLGLVRVSDAQGAGAERVHSCEVDGAGGVLRIDHPGA
jgi:hypothetical protein